MKIAVGSNNPTKINAVKQVASELFNNPQVISVNAVSGVSDMPMSDEESIIGAKNRAINALKNHDYGVGIEGGVDDMSQGMFLCAWVAVTNGDEISLACTNKTILPKNIAIELRKGRELGPLMDELTGKQGIKHTNGTIGLLTKGLINRAKAFHDAVLCAFMKFINKEYYQ